MNNKVNYPRSVKGAEAIAEALTTSTKRNNRRNPYNGKGRIVTKKKDKEFTDKDMKKVAEMDPKTKQMLLYGLGGAAGGYGIGRILDYIRGKDSSLPLMTALLAGGGAAYAKDKGYLENLSSMLAPQGVKKPTEDIKPDPNKTEQEQQAEEVNAKDKIQTLSAEDADSIDNMILGTLASNPAADIRENVIGLTAQEAKDRKDKASLANNIDTGLNAAYIADNLGTGASGLLKSKYPELFERISTVAPGASKFLGYASKALGPAALGATAVVNSIGNVGNVNDKVAINDAINKQIDALVAEGYPANRAESLRARAHDTIFNRDVDYDPGGKFDKTKVDMYNTNSQASIDEARAALTEAYRNGIRSRFKPGITDNPMSREEYNIRMANIDSEAEHLRDLKTKGRAGNELLNLAFLPAMTPFNLVGDAATMGKDVYNEYQRAATRPGNHGTWSNVSNFFSNMYNKTKDRADVMRNRVDKAKGTKYKGIAAYDNAMESPMYGTLGNVWRTTNAIGDAWDNAWR
jgi:hypothetical protein